MTRFLAKRGILIGVMLLGLLTLTFFISHVAPGDPAHLRAGPDATPEMVEVIRVKYGLDKPLMTQFYVYLKGMLVGDWGESIHSSRKVWDELVIYFPNTAELVIFSILIAIVLGVPIGVLAAVNQNTAIDHFLRVLSISGVALPMFWLGLMLQLFFALKHPLFPLNGQLHVLLDPPDPITHLILVDSLLRGQWSLFINAAQHMVLPALTLSVPGMASIIRVNRAEMLETLNKDYIVNARAQGLSAFRIIGMYALRNAMLATMAMIGLRFGWMLGGTVMVETVFDWPGVGLYAVNGAINNDFAPIIGSTIVLGFFFMLTNLVIDIIYGVLDPRVRTQI
ncbi:MAG: ABC transporter permease [Rhodospirillales bacterium]|jgi:peptide/nickel transport system permease protein|nr:ABC transporter permease [Rhodospirillales bacterium]